MNANLLLRVPRFATLAHTTVYCIISFAGTQPLVFLPGEPFGMHEDDGSNGLEAPKDIRDVKDTNEAYPLGE